MRSQDKIFYYGMISLWENRVLLIWMVDKEISDDLKPFLPAFRLWGAPKSPWGSPRASNEWPNVPWEVKIKYSTIGKLGVACFKGGKRSIWWFEAFFWLLPDTMGTPKGPPKVSNGQSRVPSKVLIRYFTMGHCLKAIAPLFCPWSKFKKMTKWQNSLEKDI